MNLIMCLYVLIYEINKLLKIDSCVIKLRCLGQFIEKCLL